MDSTYLFGRLHQEIRDADRLLLVAHKKPDGDTIGASSGFLNWLMREGKNVTIFCLDAPAPTHRYIDGIHQYTTDQNVFDHAYDVVIIFDSSDTKYCGIDILLPRLKPGHLLVNIDHHATNTRYGQLNIVLPEASSTCEIVTQFFDANQIPLDTRIATSLLTGILFDTSSFSNSGTNSKCMEAAGKLLSAGARHQDILKHTLHDKTIPGLKLWGLMLSRLQYNPAYDLVSTYLLEHDIGDFPVELVEGASNFLNAVTGDTDAILVLRELPHGLIKGSMRSVNRDISKVAKLFGGGGHKKASGFTVPGRIQETPNGPQIVPA